MPIGSGNMKKYRPAITSSPACVTVAVLGTKRPYLLDCIVKQLGIGLVLERVGVAVHWYEAEHVKNVNANEVAVAYLCVGHSDCVLRP